MRNGLSELPWETPEFMECIDFFYRIKKSSEEIKIIHYTFAMVSVLIIDFNMKASEK